MLSLTTIASAISVSTLTELHIPFVFSAGWNAPEWGCNRIEASTVTTDDGSHDRGDRQGHFGPRLTD